MTFTLDPLAGIALAAVFVATALLTIKRASFGLAALLLVAPLRFAWVLLGTEITLSKIVLAGAIVGLTTYPRLWSLLRERTAARVLLALLAIAAATALSIVHAEYHGPVLRETLKALEHVALVAIAYVIYRLDANDGLLRDAFTLVVTVMSLSALCELFVPAGSSLIFHGTVIPRITGLLGGPNQLGGYLEIAIAMLGAWCMTRNALVTRSALALCAFALALTFSRGSLVGTVIVMAVFVWCGTQPLRAIVPIVAGVLAGYAAATLLFIEQYAHQHSAVAARVGTITVSAAATSADYAGGVGHRSELWRAAWHLWRAHPLLGVGAGNYELELTQAGLPGVRTHANSWYLQALAEGGIPLIATTLAFVAIMLRALYVRVRSGGPWVLGAFAASLALCIHQTIDYLVFYQEVGTTWMLVIGIGLAAAAASETSSETEA